METEEENPGAALDEEAPQPLKRRIARAIEKSFLNMEEILSFPGRYLCRVIFAGKRRSGEKSLFAALFREILTAATEPIRTKG